MAILRKTALLLCTEIILCAIIFAVTLNEFSVLEAHLSTLLAPAAQAAFEESLAPLQDGLSSARATMMTTLMLGMLAFAALSSLLLRSIARGLAAMHASNPDADIVSVRRSPDKDRDDEIDAALAAYEHLLSRMRESFVKMQQSLTQLREVAEEVHKSSRQLAPCAQPRTDASSDIDAAGEVIRASVAVAAAKACAASRYAQASRQSVERSDAVILRTVRGIDRIAATVRDAATQMRPVRLDGVSASSGARMIRDLADQTKRLSLNAAHDAAGRGGWGKGFAVAADEVRELAEITAASTREVKELMRRMQKAGSRRGLCNPEEGSGSVAPIGTAADDMVTIVSDISGALPEQETAGAALSRKVEDIASSSLPNAVLAKAAADAVSRMTQVGIAMSKTLSEQKTDARRQSLVLRSADIRAADQPAVRAVSAMAEIIARRTNGRITLTVASGGAFGSQKDEMEQVKAGSLDMVCVDSANLTTICPLTVIVSLPFIFKSTGHMQRALDGAPGQEILASGADAGYVGLAFYDSGARSIYGNKPVRALADVLDLRLRMPQSDLCVAIASAMGAQARPMAQQEVLAGFKSGLLDAAEDELAIFECERQYEACKYFCLTEHLMTPKLLLFSKARWDALAPEDQVIIAAAARESVAVMRGFRLQREDLARRNAAAAGTIFITDVDKASFEKAMRPVYDKFVASAQQKALFAAIKAVK